MSTLRYPWVRDELLDYASQLADPKRHTDEWAARSFDIIGHFFLDDWPEPSRGVGVWIVDDEEARLVIAR